MNRLNEEAVKLIHSFEGCRLQAYRDVKGVWTIGWGHTSDAGPPKVHKGLTLTQEEADELFKKDIKKYENAVRENVKVALSDNQFGALVSFSYNVGPGALKRSTLLKKLNKGDYEGAAKEFSKWNRSGGKVYKGLIRRRAAECKLFEKKETNAWQTSPVGKPSSTPWWFSLLALLKRLIGRR